MPTKEAIKELCDTCAALYDNHDKYPEKDIGHGMSHISGVATRAMVYQEAM